MASRKRTPLFGSMVLFIASLLAIGLFSCAAVLGFDDLSAPTEGPESGADGPVETGTAVAGVSVTSSQATSAFGSQVTFTAIVAGTSGSPTGTVTFSEGPSKLGSFPLTAGQIAGTATFNTGSLAAGVHVVTATYEGDRTYAGGAAESITHTVTAAVTTTALSGAPNPSSTGQTVKLTAVVSSSAPGTISGTVSFKEGGSALGSAPISNGIAVFSTADFTAGLHDVTAHYEGSANYGPSVSAPLTASVTGPGCLGLKPTCGPTGNADCCATSVVPGGSFLRSYDGNWFPNASNPATVSEFRLDTYEVTVSRFRAFVQAGKGTRADLPPIDSGAHPLIAGSGWLTAYNNGLTVETSALLVAARCTFPQPGTYNWTDIPGANENKPMNCINWYEAFAFCAWDGGRLPTEAEWNFAAAGGEEQRARAWSVPPSSETITPSHAVYSAAGTQAVGTHPLGDGRWGHRDLAGNVWEWTLDSFVALTTLPNPCTDCTNVATRGGDKVIKGGGFNFAEYDALVAVRQKAGLGFRGTDVGVRCARTP